MAAHQASTSAWSWAHSGSKSAVIVDGVGLTTAAVACAG